MELLKVILFRYKLWAVFKGAIADFVSGWIAVKARSAYVVKILETDSI